MGGYRGRGGAGEAEKDRGDERKPIAVRSVTKSEALPLRRRRGLGACTLTEDRMTSTIRRAAAARTRLFRPRAAVAVALVLAAAVSLTGCDDPFQVIEEVTFDPSLGVDLTQMDRLDSGVYIQDLVEGTGNEITPTSFASLTYEGYLTDGTKFGEGPYGLQLGDQLAIVGFELGVIGMKEGGQRLLVIPPDLGYGNQEQRVIPAGSVLIFKVTAEDVPAPTTPAA